MSERTRQNLGAICLGVVLAVVGLVVFQASETAGALLIAGALLCGVVGLLNIALDLLGVLKPDRDRR